RYMFVLFFFFFFQAEDGIRDDLVTGVQTCALPISGIEVVTLPAVGLVNGQIRAFVRGFRESYRAAKQSFRARPPQAVLAMGGFRSEERRVGKEWRAGWWTVDEKKK